jgi:hypothetical protein
MQNLPRNTEPGANIGGTDWISVASVIPFATKSTLPEQVLCATLDLRKMRHVRMCCVVGLLVYAGAAVAQPQTAASVSEPTVASFEAGRKLLASHHPAEACAMFARVLELEPDHVGVMLNLGLCNEELDKLATALSWFRRALARASELKLVDSVRAATEKIAALSRAVPTVRLALSPPAAVATVTLDGVIVEASDLGRVELDAGHHVVEVTAAGPAVVREEVDAVDRAVTSVDLVIPPAQHHAGPPATGPDVAAQPARDDSAVTQRRRAYIAGAIGGGLTLGSVALGLAGRSAVGSTEHPDVQQRWKDTVMYGGTAMFVLGSAALGWAVWTYLHAPGEQAHRTIIAPVVGDRSVGVGAQGAF